MEIKIVNLEQIREAAKEFIANIGERTVFAFYGKMGADKTIFIEHKSIYKLIIITVINRKT